LYNSFITILLQEPKALGCLLILQSSSSSSAYWNHAWGLKHKGNSVTMITLNDFSL